MTTNQRATEFLNDKYGTDIRNDTHIKKNRDNVVSNMIYREGKGIFGTNNVIYLIEDGSM